MLSSLRSLRGGGGTSLLETRAGDASAAVYVSRVNLIFHRQLANDVRHKLAAATSKRPRPLVVADSSWRSGGFNGEQNSLSGFVFLIYLVISK